MKTLVCVKWASKQEPVATEGRVKLSYQVVPAMGRPDRYDLAEIMLYAMGDRYVGQAHMQFTIMACRNALSKDLVRGVVLGTGDCTREAPWGHLARPD